MGFIKQVAQVVNGGAQILRDSFLPPLTVFVIPQGHASPFRDLPDLFTYRKGGGTFKAFFDFYVEGVTGQAVSVFKELLEIADAHEAHLMTGAVDWAESQTKHLIRSHRHNIVIWVRSVCDEQPHDRSESMDERIFWRKWQAPLFLIMKPCHSQPYDSSRVWERQDSETSSQLLEHFSDRYVLHLEMCVEHVVGGARVERATSVSVPQPDGRSAGQFRASASKRPHSRSRLAQMRAIFAALQAGDKGPKYCETVDRYKPPVSQAWKDAGWPGSYINAYRDADWARKIQDQKSKMRKKYDAMTPVDREAIIQGTASTRHTR